MMMKKKISKQKRTEQRAFKKLIRIGFKNIYCTSILKIYDQMQEIWIQRQYYYICIYNYKLIKLGCFHFSTAS